MQLSPVMTSVGLPIPCSHSSAVSLSRPCAYQTSSSDFDVLHSEMEKGDPRTLTDQCSCQNSCASGAPGMPGMNGMHGKDGAHGQQGQPGIQGPAGPAG